MAADSGPLEGAILLSADGLQAVWNNLLREKNFFKALYLDPALCVTTPPGGGGRGGGGGGGGGGKTPPKQNEGPTKMVSPPTTTASRKKGPVPNKDEDVDDEAVDNDLITKFLEEMSIIPNRNTATTKLREQLRSTTDGDQSFKKSIEDYVLSKWGEDKTLRDAYVKRLAVLKRIIITYKDAFMKNPTGRHIIGLSMGEIKPADDLKTPNQNPTIAPDPNPNGDSALPLDADGLNELDAYLNQERDVPGYPRVKKLLTDTEVSGTGGKRVDGPLKGDDGSTMQKKLLFTGADETRGLSDRARAIYAHLMEDDNETMRDLFAKHYGGVWGEISRRAENGELTLSDIARVGGAAGAAGAAGADERVKAIDLPDLDPLIISLLKQDGGLLTARQALSVNYFLDPTKYDEKAAKKFDKGKYGNAGGSEEFFWKDGNPKQKLNDLYKITHDKQGGLNDLGQQVFVRLPNWKTLIEKLDETRQEVSQSGRSLRSNAVAGQDGGTGASSKRK